MILGLAMMAVAAVPAGAITIEYLTLPAAGSAGFDVTYDGSRAVANFSGQVYLLDEAGNFTLINSLAAGGSGTTSISADGTVIAVNTRDSLGLNIPAILRESEGWTAELLETPPGYLQCDYGKATAYDLDGTGNKLTGLLWDGCVAKAFLWTPTTGMQDLGETRATGISQDGSVLGGFDRTQRRPAYWPVEGTTGGVATLLHHPEDQGEVHAISSNGQVLIGTSYPYGSDPAQTGYQAFRWEMGDTTITQLGTLSGSLNDISVARYIADNGVIIGTSGPTSVNVTTFIWTPTIGMTDLKQYLIDQGADLPNYVKLTWPRAFSNDGSIFICEYIDYYGGWGYLRVDFGKTSSTQDIVRRTASLTDVSPNPFNPMTTVSFSLEKRQNATVTIYDVSGRKIDVLADGEFQAGDHELVWRGKDLAGREMSSGTYIVHLESDESSDSRTISLVR
jgi:hypothetical protein